MTELNLPDLVSVQVTEAHVERGKKYEPQGCPLALAIAEALGIKLTELAVGSDDVSIYFSDELTKFYDLPPAAKRFRQRFDGRGEVGPFVFRMKRRT